jgi:hypothetical protein
MEGPGHADAASAVVSLTLVTPAISISSSPASNLGKEVADDRHAGPSDQPKVPILEHTMLFPNKESTIVVPVGRNPFAWGGPQLT